MIQGEKSASKVLVSPPIQPTESLLERLYTEIAMLPVTWQEALTPAQLRILAGVRKEEQRERLEAAEALCEMRRGPMRGVESCSACSEPMRECDETRSQEDTSRLSPSIMFQSKGEADEEMDPAIKTTRQVKTSDPLSLELEIPREFEGDSEKAIRQNTTLLKANPRKMPRRIVETPKSTLKKVQSRKRSPTKITLHLTTPRKGISKMAKASPRRFGQAHGSAEKRNLELAWLEECNKVKAHSATRHAQ